MTLIVVGAVIVGVVVVQFERVQKRSIFDTNSSIVVGAIAGYDIQNHFRKN
jgi:uncharacterized protein YcfJ